MADRLAGVEWFAGCSRPLFAGYVFCRTSGDAVVTIVSTPGVIRIVGDGIRPLAVAAEEIESIRRIVSAGAAAEPWPFLESGTRVRIEDGTLRGTEGVIVDSVAEPRGRLHLAVAAVSGRGDCRRVGSARNAWRRRLSRLNGTSSAGRPALSELRLCAPYPRSLRP
jgi:hypothetical protein